MTDSQAKDAKVLRVTLISNVPVRLKRGELHVLKGICHTKCGRTFQPLVSGTEEVPTPVGLIVYDQIVDVNKDK